MAFSISEFKANGLQYGGARPTMFNVTFSSPSIITLSTQLLQQFPLMCSASSVPASEVPEIDVPYFGRKIYVAGDRTFRPWTCTVLNDEDYGIRTMLEAWSNAINELEANIRINNSDESYKTDLTVNQLGKDGSVVRAYKLVGGWPTSIDAIPLNWSSVNQIEEFNVTFRYDYWIPLESSANTTLVSNQMTYASDGASDGANSH